MSLQVPRSIQIKVTSSLLTSGHNVIDGFSPVSVYGMVWESQPIVPIPIGFTKVTPAIAQNSTDFSRDIDKYLRYVIKLVAMPMAILDPLLINLDLSSNAIQNQSWMTNEEKVFHAILALHFSNPSASYRAFRSAVASYASHVLDGIASTVGYDAVTHRINITLKPNTQLSEVTLTNNPSEEDLFLITDLVIIAALTATYQDRGSEQGILELAIDLIDGNVNHGITYSIIDGSNTVHEGNLSAIVPAPDALDYKPEDGISDVSVATLYATTETEQEMAPLRFSADPDTTSMSLWLYMLDAVYNTVGSNHNGAAKAMHHSHFTVKRMADYYTLKANVLPCTFRFAIKQDNEIRYAPSILDDHGTNEYLQKLVSKIEQKNTWGSAYPEGLRQEDLTLLYTDNITRRRIYLYNGSNETIHKIFNVDLPSKFAPLSDNDYPDNSNADKFYRLIGSTPDLSEQFELPAQRYLVVDSANNIVNYAPVGNSSGKGLCFAEEVRLLSVMVAQYSDVLTIAADSVSNTGKIPKPVVTDTSFWSRLWALLKSNPLLLLALLIIAAILILRNVVKPAIENKKTKNGDNSPSNP